MDISLAFWNGRRVLTLGKIRQEALGSISVDDVIPESVKVETYLEIFLDNEMTKSQWVPASSVTYSK